MKFELIHVADENKIAISPLTGSKANIYASIFPGIPIRCLKTDSSIIVHYIFSSVKQYKSLDSSIVR